MENPLLTLKPSITNALLPSFLKNLFYAIIISGIAFLISLILRFFDIIDYTTSTLLVSAAVLIIVVDLIPTIIRLIILYNTKYLFYPHHLIREFELIIIKRYSVPYNQIVNIKTKVSLWDRLCNAGDIIIHTAEDKAQDLILHYIKNPQELEHRLYKMAHITKDKKVHN
ncbi:PH domain-containing protein [Candidatus Woesearchaeota archaeon]|nr:PH domain-containing protein [Candidatus Woesearchaeota archaeon]